MNFHAAAIAVCAALLVGCSPNDSEKARLNRSELAEPTPIGTLKDGRIVYHSRVWVAGEWQHLFIAGQDVTVNREVAHRNGKVTTYDMHATAYIGPGKPDVVIIDGQQYNVDEVRAALVRDEDAQRAKEQK